MDIADVSRVPADVLRNVEADTYWCMSRLLDGIQVSQAAGAPPPPRLTWPHVRSAGRGREWCTGRAQWGKAGRQAWDWGGCGRCRASLRYSVCVSHCRGSPWRGSCSTGQLPGRSGPSKTS